MTRFTSRLAIAAVTFGLIGGFGPGLLQPAFAGMAGGHEATEHGGKGGTDKSSADKGRDNASPDRGGDKSSADRGRDTPSADKGSIETETEAPEAAGSGR